MSIVSTAIQTGSHVGNTVSDELLAINMRSHHNRTDDGSDFRQVMDHIETNSVRFPGGTVSEEHFDITDPNATRVENVVQVIHPELIPSRSDTPIVRTVTPLSDYLTFVNDRGGDPVIVLPTYRYFDQQTRTLTSNAESEIRAFVRELLTDQHGDVENVTLEIGNEFYQTRFNWTDDEFGRLQVQIAEWVDDEASSLGVREDLTLLAQAGRNLSQNQLLANQFDGSATIDGVILHFYGTSGVGDPFAMGSNIARELAETNQSWSPLLGTDFDLAITEWNVGESGESSTVVNGIMRTAPLLHMFAEMLKGGADTAMIWAARTDGPGGLSLRQDEGNDLTPSGKFFEMLTESTNGMDLVDPGSDYLMRNASGQAMGYKYTFEKADRSVTYFASAVAHDFKISADLSQQIRDGAYVYWRKLGVAPGDDPTDYWSDAAVSYDTDLSIVEVDGRQLVELALEPYELIELHIVHGAGVSIEGEREYAIDDALHGSDFSDILDGQGGADKIAGKSGNDRLEGDLGADVLRGNKGADSLFGGDGHDRLLGGLGDDELFGGRGKDRLFGHDDDDTLTGEQGKDTLYGENGDDVLFGGRGTDMLSGGAGNDTLVGGVGADRLNGDDGADSLSGLMGADLLYGGSGNDLLAGNAGADGLFGGEGADVLIGGMGRDSLTGGAGADEFRFDNVTGQDTITDFEDGVDAIAFLIESFGFADLTLTQDEADTVVRHREGEIRLVDINAETLDAEDFRFGPLA